MSGQAHLQDSTRRVLDRVPMRFRTRWPLRRFYWQQSEIDAAQVRATQLADDLGWTADQLRKEGT